MKKVIEEDKTINQATHRGTDYSTYLDEDGYEGELKKVELRKKKKKRKKSLMKKLSDML